MRPLASSHDGSMDAQPVPLARPALGDEEVEAASLVIRSGMLCQGQRTAEFEATFAAAFGVEHAIAVSSGSAALLVALQALGVGPGDEVIVPDMTFISTATAALYLGARPVLCDIQLSDYCIDPAFLETLITPRTKVIVPVHYAGHTADMEPILALASKRGISVLEDAAEAHLARYRGDAMAGSLGDLAIFSFTPSKPITTGEGGMIVTNDEALDSRCRLIRNFGDEGKFAWHGLGLNFRLNEVAAAIGICQLRRLDEFVRQRRSLARRYSDALANEHFVITPRTRTPTDCNFQLYTIRLVLEGLDATRDQIIRELSDHGVSSRLYYPALHRMGVFRQFEVNSDSAFPAAVDFDRSALSLPMYSDLTEGEQDRVTERLLDVLRAHRR